jgi:hypothetical protein
MRTTKLFPFHLGADSIRSLFASAIFARESGRATHE